MIADQHHERDELGRPLPQEEVADQRQREVRVEELAERRHQREEQQPEADEDEPVPGADPVPLQHPGVPSDSLSIVAVRRPGLSVRAAGWPTFITADDRPDGPDEEGDADDGDRERDDDGEDLHGRLLVGCDVGVRARAEPRAGAVPASPAGRCDKDPTCR